MRYVITGPGKYVTEIGDVIDITYIESGSAFGFFESGSARVWQCDNGWSDSCSNITGPYIPPPKFKAGDRVKIVRKVDYGYWTPGMDSLVGKCGVVLDADSQHARVGCGYAYPRWFPHESLELAPLPEPEWTTTGELRKKRCGHETEGAYTVCVDRGEGFAYIVDQQKFVRGEEVEWRNVPIVAEE